MRGLKGGMYLDLYEFFDAVDDPYVLIALRAFSNYSFIACSHPAILEGFLIGFIIVKVAENNARRSNDKFSRLIIAGNFVSLNSYYASFVAGK